MAEFDYEALWDGLCTHVFWPNPQTEETDTQRAAAYLREQIEAAFVARATHEAMAARITELEADLTRYVESLRYMREAADRQRAFEQSAHVDGVRAGIEAAEKAILVAQYDPAPYTKASHAIRALDPEAIVRAGIKVAPTP